MSPDQLLLQLKFPTIADLSTADVLSGRQISDR
jgi:hypothetical protein